MFFNFGYLSRHEVIGHSHLILSFPGVYWCGVSSLRATRWGGPVCFLLFCCPFPAFFWINQVFSISLLYFLYRLLSKSFPTIFFSQWFCSGTEHKHSPVECRWVGVVLLWSPLFILEPSPVPLLSHTWTHPPPRFAGVTASHRCTIPPPPHPRGFHDHIRSKPTPQRHYVGFKQLSLKGIMERRKKRNNLCLHICWSFPEPPFLLSTWHRFLSLLRTSFPTPRGTLPAGHSLALYLQTSLSALIFREFFCGT